MANMSYLDADEDMQWISDVHYPDAWRYKAAIIHGNEDSPSKIELFLRDDYRADPTVLERTHKGELLVSHLSTELKTMASGEKPRKHKSSKKLAKPKSRAKINRSLGGMR